MTGRGKNLEQQQEDARSHPLRVDILALYALDESRSLLPRDLLADLPDDPDVSVSVIAYHLLILRDAELLPS